MNPLTEMYSAIKAEVPIDDDESTSLNRKLLNELDMATNVRSLLLNCCIFLFFYFSQFFYSQLFEQVLVCGQAKSHCVNYTVRDIAENLKTNPNKIILLEDGELKIFIFFFVWKRYPFIIK